MVELHTNISVVVLELLYFEFVGLEERDEGELELV